MIQVFRGIPWFSVCEKESEDVGPGDDEPWKLLIPSLTLWTLSTLGTMRDSPSASQIFKKCSNLHSVVSIRALLDLLSSSLPPLVTCIQVFGKSHFMFPVEAISGVW